ncbi:MAG: hypothetical protein ACE5LU_02230 [Anaerolineae bacterium]
MEGLLAIIEVGAVGAPRRLTTLVEGESLFNDGTAIVVFQRSRGREVYGDRGAEVQG